MPASIGKNSSFSTFQKLGRRIRFTQIKLHPLSLGLETFPLGWWDTISRPFVNISLSAHNRIFPDLAYLVCQISRISLWLKMGHFGTKSTIVPFRGKRGARFYHFQVTPPNIQLFTKNQKIRRWSPNPKLTQNCHFFTFLDNEVSYYSSMLLCRTKRPS